MPEPGRLLLGQRTTKPHGGDCIGPHAMAAGWRNDPALDLAATVKGPRYQIHRTVRANPARNERC